jgi:leucyl aminopeptidase
MIDHAFSSPKVYTSRKRKTHVAIKIIENGKLSSWLKKQDQATQDAAAETGFDKEECLILPLRNKGGAVKTIIARMGKEPELYDMARIVSKLAAAFSYDFLKSCSFEISGLKGKHLEDACISWGLAAYEFIPYKKEKRKEHATLLLPDTVNKKRVKSIVESITLLRDLVNMPANLLGPDELEAAVKTLAKPNNASVKIIKDQQLLDKNFPLIYTVGQASPRRPRLIEMTWGNARHPKVTLVGKGVVFDTGGLDLKPSQYMRLMKKDMGGAAHALALAKLVMDHKLPVRLKLLIPAVENAVGGEAFRPGDIIKSRKGLFVENTNTDAEGRLILADTLTYASEEKPKIIIDFATLTGSARAALGPDVPAFFSNQEELYPKIQTLSKDAHDAVWPMPLWQPYRKHIENSVGDLVNSAGLPGDLIYSALFLESFLEHDTPWMHLDVFSWEQTGKAGRPKGAADTGLRAMFAYLQDRYG